MTFKLIFAIFLINIFVWHSGRGQDLTHYQQTIEDFISKVQLDSADAVCRKFRTYTSNVFGDKSPEFGKAIFLTGKVNFLKGDLVLAEKNQLEAFKILKKTHGEKHAETERVLYEMGVIFFEIGNYTIASRIFDHNLEIAADIYGKKHYLYAKILDALGSIAVLKGDFASGELYHQKASDIIKSNVGENHIEYADNLVYQGFLYSEKGFYTAAEALFSKANFIYKKNNVPLYANARLKLSYHLAELFSKLHNYAEAAYLLESNIGLCKKYYPSYHYLIGRCESSLGKIYLKSGHLDIALQHLQISKLIFEKSLGKSHLQTVLVDEALAHYYINVRKFQSADSLLNIISSKVQSSLGEQNITFARLESSIGRLYYHQGKYAEAIAYYQRSLAIKQEILEESHPEYIETINDLCFVFWAAGKMPQAEKYFDKSAKNYLRQFNRYFVFLSEKEKSLFYKDIRLFFDKYHNFILERSASKPELLSVIYNNQLTTKALLFHSTQQLRKQIHESNDTTIIKKYDKWIRLKEQLAKLYKLDPDDIVTQNIPKDSLEDVANSLEKELSLRVELKSYKKDEVGTEDWTSVRQVLSDDESSLEIVRIPSFSPLNGGSFTKEIFYAGLLVTKSSSRHPNVMIIKNGKDLEQKYVNFYRNAVHHHIQDEVSYDQYWRPFRESIAKLNIKKLFLTVDGIYNQINLNTLYNVQDNRYLFDEIDVHFLTNSSDIINVKSSLQSLSKNKSVFLGFPDYDYNKQADSTKLQVTHHPQTHHHKLHTRGSIDELFRGGKISHLPGTKTEVEAIAQIFEKNSEKVDIYLGQYAHEEELKKVAHPNMLHIATHGFFLEDPTFYGERDEDSLSQALLLEEYETHPLMRCGIMLAGASNAYSDETLEKELDAINNGYKHEDGILTAFEAMNLNLINTELVVLSACETGLGEVKNGEGVYGLQRAFQTAGAKSIIMSLWKVSDLATQKLMTTFYDEWFKLGDKRKAFREAQLALRQEFPEPFFWGAFILIGE